MSTIGTNRALYLRIAELTDERRGTTCCLRDYLAVLLEELFPFRDRNEIDSSTFAECLRSAFDGAPQHFERLRRWHSHPPWRSFSIVSRTLCRQISELERMDAAGMLDNELRYFGIDAPGGGRWYNFDPVSYIECAAAGSVGGWQPEDGAKAGRCYVPGEVSYMAGDGSIQSCKPEELDNPVVPLTALPWSQVNDFLECGQWYE